MFAEASNRCVLRLRSNWLTNNARLGVIPNFPMITVSKIVTAAPSTVIAVVKPAISKAVMKGNFIF